MHPVQHLRAGILILAVCLEAGLSSLVLFYQMGVAAHRRASRRVASTLAAVQLRTTARGVSTLTGMMLALLGLVRADRTAWHWMCIDASAWPATRATTVLSIRRSANPVHALTVRARMGLPPTRALARTAGEDQIALLNWIIVISASMTAMRTQFATRLDPEGSRAHVLKDFVAMGAHHAQMLMSVQRLSGVGS